MTRPTIYVIAGPNGAGKSTLYRDVIAPRVSATFINADLIQRDELGDPSMGASYKAAEIAENRRRDYLKQGLSFVTESTFSHPSKLDLIEDAQQAGFRVVLYHVNVRSPDLSVHRVAARVREGGHDVPEDKIRERYARNGALIRRAAMRADYAFVYDNSMLNQAPALALAMRAGQVFEASDRVPAWARDLYAHELSGLSPSRLNPGAASFDEGKQIVAKLGGPDATLSVPAIRKGSGYGGQIIGETSLHYIQQIDTSRYVAHFKSAFLVFNGLAAVVGCFLLGALPQVQVRQPQAGAVIGVHAQHRVDEQARVFAIAHRSQAARAPGVGLVVQLRGVLDEQHMAIRSGQG